MIKLIIICVLALFLHLFTKWGESWRTAKESGSVPPGLFAFSASIMPQIAIGVVGAVLAFMGADAMGWMNPAMAAACGYMGSSICKKMVDQAQSSFGS